LQIIRGDDIPRVVEVELAVTRIRSLATVTQAEKTLAIDRHIERIARGANRALREFLFDRRHLGADTDCG
jgi:hypothetical protein